MKTETCRGQVILHRDNQLTKCFLWGKFMTHAKLFMIHLTCSQHLQGLGSRLVHVTVSAAKCICIY